jgi:hypothetical protein
VASRISRRRATGRRPRGGRGRSRDQEGIPGVAFRPAALGTEL